MALTDSYAHMILLSIGAGLGWDATQQQEIAYDGLRRNPQDVSLYFQAVKTHPGGLPALG